MIEHAAVTLAKPPRKSTHAKSGKTRPRPFGRRGDTPRGVGWQPNEQSVPSQGGSRKAVGALAMLIGDLKLNKVDRQARWCNTALGGSPLEAQPPRNGHSLN